MLGIWLRRCRVGAGPFRVARGRFSCARVGCTWPQPDGHYALAGLPVGDYVIAFALDRIEDGVAFPDGYVRRFWDEVQNFGEATPVGSATPTVISGIDASLSRGEEILPPGVRVTPKAFGKDRRLPLTNGYRG